MIDIKKLSDRYDVRRMDDSDADDILFLCMGNPMYYKYCEAEPSREQVMEDLHVTPPGMGMDDKYYLGFFSDGKLIAVLDLIDGYPAPDIGYIGFFMMDAAFQGQQTGSSIIQDVCAYLKQSGKTSVHLAIAEDNPQANHFWKKNGFVILKTVERNGWKIHVAERKL